MVRLDAVHLSFIGYMQRPGAASGSNGLHVHIFSMDYSRTLQGFP